MTDALVPLLAKTMVALLALLAAHGGQSAAIFAPRSASPTDSRGASGPVRFGLSSSTWLSEAIVATLIAGLAATPQAARASGGVTYDATGGGRWGTR